MPPRKTPIRRKKSSAATTPTPVNDHKSSIPKAEAGAELADIVDIKTEETLGQIEVSNSIPAHFDGDSTTSIASSPKSTIKEEVVLENSSAGDVNESINEVGEADVGGDKVTEDLRLTSEDCDKGKLEVGNVMNEYGIVCLEKDKIDETIIKEKEDLHHGSENVDQDKQLETVAVVKGENEEEKAHEPNADKARSNNHAALVVEDGGNGDRNGTAEIVSPEDSVQAFTTITSSENNIALLLENDEENDEDSEGDDADNEGDEDPSQDPVSDHKKNKDIEIYVGGLDKNTVEDDLINIFQQFGELKSTRIVRNSNTKKSKGFAFVRFASPDQAKHALSELKDGVEVRGKRIKISESQDNHTLYLGNISKTWKKEEVLQQLKQYGIEHIELIRLPENPKSDGKNKGFAFLEFNSHSDAVSAFQRLKKPDAVFGRDISAKVAFAQTPLHQNDEDLLQAKRVFLEGLTKDWNEEKVKEICKKYGEIVKVNLCQNPRTKHKDFGFITFASNENALACVEGINNADIGGEVKIKANIAKPHSKPQKQGFSGGFKVEASTSNKSKEILEPKSIKTKGGLNTQQVRRNNNDASKNKVKVPQQKEKNIKNGESSSKTAELPKMKGVSNSQQSNKKRKAPSEQKPNPPINLRHGDQDPTKKPKFGGEGQNSKTASKAGSQKRKGREEGGNRNTHNKKPFKKPKGNMHGRERDNFRNQNSDNHIRRAHDDYRISNTRYMDSSSYAPQTYSYRMPPDSLPTRRFKEMEPHAGYTEPVSARGYAQPVVRTTHNHHHHHPHQTVYLSPGIGSQSQSQSQRQLHSRYSDRPIMTTQSSHRDYIPEVQPYRAYQQSSLLQLPRGGDPYDSDPYTTLPHDARSSRLLTYAGASSVPSSHSQVRNHTSYYQGGGSYSGGYSSQRTYY